MLGLPLNFLHMEDYAKPDYIQDEEKEIPVECNIKPELCVRCQSSYELNGFLSPNDSCLECMKILESERTCGNCENYQCAYCNLNFPTTFLLQKHTFLHCSEAGIEKQQCHQCNRTFVNFEPSRHNCSSKFICHICGGGLSSAYNLRVHLMKHSGDLPHKCQCGKSFSKPSELTRHSRVHSGERLDKRQGKSYPCEICHKPFTRPADLRRHVLTHSGTRPFACTVCGLAFCDTSNLKKHIMTHTKNSTQIQAKTYHCSYCNKLFSRPSELKRHFATHTKSRPFSCDFCGLAFGDASNLRKHISGHARSGMKECVMCSASFENFDDLEVHVATHPKVNDDHECVRCDICGKTFSSEIYLTGHRAGHTEARPFPCGQCLKTFKSLSHLKNHLLTHTGDRGHVCETCGKGFLTKSSLRRHESIHSRSLPVQNLIHNFINHDAMDNKIIHDVPLSCPQ